MKDHPCFVKGGHLLLRGNHNVMVYEQICHNYLNCLSGEQGDAANIHPQCLQYDFPQVLSSKMPTVLMLRTTNLHRYLSGMEVL